MHVPALILDLAIILGVAALVTFLFRRIRQPVVLGYVVAGIIVGPYTPNVFSVTDTESIKVWAELGVIFLMFTLGLEFSFRRLARVGMSAAVTALIQIGAMLVWGGITAKILGWSRMDAAFLGCMIAISSTTIIIKALEELGLKTKRFAELVFGILIVEDLAAILMLVALTNVAKTSEIGGFELLLAGGKLAIVVGVWFLVGMFLVPRSVRAVSRHGNDEMLTVMAIGMCLALVVLAAYFQYSVALGAFIMGSILAESAEAKRIEHLVAPLKDVFGAVFFVSVGMLLDPQTILDNLGAVALISSVIIVGMVTSVGLGALVTGQSLRVSVQTGFSMAQVGEFSFIIGSLGLAYGVISPKLYPIIVAASLVTTFTTPYLIKSSGPFASWLERRLPERVRATLQNYVTWVQHRAAASEGRQAYARGLVKAGLNGVVVIALFTTSASYLVPLVAQYVENDYAARGLAWLTAVVLSAPSIWALVSARGKFPLLSRFLTVSLVGLLSIEYFPAPETLAVTCGLCALVFIFFRRRIGAYYRWIEDQFQSGFQAETEQDRLVLWDAHLAEVRVPARSFLVGKSLGDLALRENFALNVVVVVRDGDSIVAPKADSRLYPGDVLLCFATDAELEIFRGAIERSAQEAEASNPITAPLETSTYELRRLKVKPGTKLSGATIRTAGIGDFDCIVVGIERRGQRIANPKSDLSLDAGDVLWLVGDGRNLQKLDHATTTAISSPS